jgi:hypothetical protein
MQNIRYFKFNLENINYRLTFILVSIAFEIQQTELAKKNLNPNEIYKKVSHQMDCEKSNLSKIVFNLIVNGNFGSERKYRVSVFSSR